MKRSWSAVILAGGLGSRLASLDMRTPKAMLSFAERPFLGYIVLNLIRAGCLQVIINVGHRGDVIRGYFSTAYWADMPIDLVVQPPFAGTGEALMNAARFVSTDHVVSLNGDTVVDLEIDGFVDAHVASCTGATIALTRRRDAQNAGAIAVDDRGAVISSDESAPTALTAQAGSTVWRGASTGVIAFCVKDLLHGSKALPSRTSAGAPTLESRLIPSFIAGRLINAFDNADRFVMDFGRPERLAWLRANQDAVLSAYQVSSSDIPPLEYRVIRSRRAGSCVSDGTFAL